MSHDETIRERALDWAVRTGDPGFTDWEGFTLWLEESPAHARAYDEVAAAVAHGADLAGQVANDDQPIIAPPVRRRWAMGALAAALAVVVGLSVTLGGKDRYVVQTAPGELRTVALSEGSSLTLAGGTRIELDQIGRAHV